MDDRKGIRYSPGKDLTNQNQDDGVRGHAVPPRTTRADRKSNGKEVRHQGNKK